MESNSLKQVQTGVMFIRASITVFLLATLAGAAAVFSLMTPLSFYGLAVGGVVCWGLIMLAGLTAFIGKIFCVQTTVGRNLVAGSLALDVISLMGYGADYASVTSWIWLISYGLFIGFFFVLGESLGDMTISEGAMSVAKNYGISVAVGLVATLTGWAWLGLISFVFVVIAFFAYLALLTQTVTTLKARASM